MKNLFSISPFSHTKIPNKLYEIFWEIIIITIHLQIK